LRQRLGAGFWRTAMEVWPEPAYPHPSTPGVLCKAPKSREVRVVKPLPFPVQDTRARASAIVCFPCRTATRSFLRFSAPHRAFSLACSQLSGLLFAWDCSHAGGPVRSPDQHQVIKVVLHLTHGSLQPRVRHDRCCARVAARIALSSGTPREQYARAKLAQSHYNSIEH
jgi:hypothetical protein